MLCPRWVPTLADSNTQQRDKINPFSTKKLLSGCVVITTRYETLHSGDLFCLLPVLSTRFNVIPRTATWGYFYPWKEVFAYAYILKIFLPSIFFSSNFNIAVLILMHLNHFELIFVHIEKVHLCVYPISPALLCQTGWLVSNVCSWHLGHKIDGCSCVGLFPLFCSIGLFICACSKSVLSLSL